jgi:hypothetical protein
MVDKGKDKTKARRRHRKWRRFDRATWNMIGKAGMLVTIVGPVLPTIMHR